MGYLKKGKWMTDEKFVSHGGRGVCVCVKNYGRSIDVTIETRDD
jgi:hypothetical protein